jgi:hypothetical protein
VNSTDDEEKIGRLKRLVEKVQGIFSVKKEIWCPYFKTHVHLNADGMHHLMYRQDRIPRNINERLLKLALVPKALQIISNSGTLQEIRVRVERSGPPAKDGFYKTKEVKYWGFHAIVGSSNMIKIVVVVKKVGEGNFVFWSVLPHRKFNNQKLYDEGIEGD